MKYCPKCNSRYDEEVLRFCMKDGTPLLNEEEPKFIAMPSESLDGPEDDPGEVTVIRRNPPAPSPLPDNFDDDSFAPNQPSSPRIVVPTSQVPPLPTQQQRPVPQYQSPQKSNTVIVVLLTMIGTLAVLGVGVLFFWFLQKDNNAANGNINTSGNFANLNTNVNNNLGFDFNANANLSSVSNTNSVSNVNANTTVKTPSPTPKPSPSISPTPLPTQDDDDEDIPPRPTPQRTPNPTQTPIIIRPGSTPQMQRMNPQQNRTPNGGVLNGQALRLTTPSYPQAAKLMKAGGEVRVQVSVDDNGNITSAKAVSGHPLLRQSAEADRTTI